MTPDLFGVAEPTAVSADERRDRWRLSRSENVGPITWHRLMSTYGSAAAALAALPDLARRGGRARPITLCSQRQADSELKRLAALDGRLVTWGEPDYPPLLQAVEDAPPVLTVRGHGHLLQRPGVAMVGTRNASAAARRFARDLARIVAEAGWLVVSGMARGVDTEVHQGALAAGTAAVLAGGVDVIYPPENEALYEGILATGVVISEMPPGVEPQARHFPRRNRIISGLAHGTVVIEATARSGSLITARLAGEQGREVMAVPGFPSDPRARGPNGLIRDGATLIRSADDILEVLQALPHGPLADPAGPVGGLGAPPVVLDAAARDQVMQALSPTPVTVDEIIRLTTLPAGVVQTILLELELAGRIARQPGQRVALA